MDADTGTKLSSRYLSWKKALLPVQCIDGYFFDGWLGQRAKFEILGAQQVAFDVFLPPNPDGRPTKTVLVELDGKSYGEFEVIRGTSSRLEIALDDPAALHILDLITEKEPWNSADVRDLGLVCVRLQIDDDEWIDLDQVRSRMIAGDADAQVVPQSQDTQHPVPQRRQTQTFWGGLEQTQDNTLDGWLLDLSDLERDLDIRCVIDGIALEQVPEFRSHDDLLGFGIGAASRVFRFDVPERFLDGHFHDVNFAIGMDGLPILAMPYSVCFEQSLIWHGEPDEYPVPTPEAAPEDKAEAAGPEGAAKGDPGLQLCEENLDVAYYTDQLAQQNIKTDNPAEHYFDTGWKLGLDPTEWFSTAGYLSLHLDVEKAGVNPFVHYLTTGRLEGRDTVQVQKEDTKAHTENEWVGYTKVSQIARFPWERDKTALEALDFTVTLLGQDPVDALAEMKFPAVSKAPVVSIIIPCIGLDMVTAECLKSIEQAWPTDFEIEVVIADNASVGPFYKALGKHPSIRTKRFRKNIGFGPACNQAADMATGEFLLFLNNDCQVAPGMIETMHAVFGDDETAGVVGPKILSFDGSLQEAGCLIKSDGTGQLVGHGSDPATPRFNYRRQVEHVSGAAYMMRRDLFFDLGGFDPIYAPAYCEDADLSMKVRDRGLTILYEPDAVVAHHLSKTTSAPENTTSGEVSPKHKLIATNRQKLLSRWQSTLSDPGLRTIALYLPQYHTIPQNDLWWGKGFTEWTNVARATANFEGQNQPRRPTELGYYDLRVPEVMQEQANLARRHGIHGFCYYYYWFDGERILETPIERMLASGSPDMPFCLCWANENWTRRWDGSDKEILLKQTYTDKNYIKMMTDMARYLKDERYIRINGRPLVLIYRVKEIPNPRRMTEAWRNVCRSAGVGEICIGIVESFELCPNPEPPERFGCDIAVEFPAHGMAHDTPIDVVRTDPSWTGRVHDYTSFAAAFMKRPEPAFKRIRSVLVGWDNTPRHRARSLVLNNATPGAFQAWLEWVYQRTLEQNQGDERLVFINAWNEWGEGSYLEPDEHFGRGYLQAVENALESIRRGGNIFDV